MMLQWVALISTGLVSVFLILLSVPLPAFLVRLVLKLVHNPTVAYVLKASLVIMGVIFVCTFPRTLARSFARATNITHAPMLCVSQLASSICAAPRRSTRSCQPTSMAPSSSPCSTTSSAPSATCTSTRCRCSCSCTYSHARTHMVANPNHALATHTMLPLRRMVLRLRTVLSENTELKARLARVSSTTAATAAAAGTGTGASPHHHAE